MEEKKNYYAIIPANVRYDENLTANAKLLYGEITALCNEKGYCWASNDYFSKLYKVSKTSISKWISQLEKKGYIQTEIIYKEGSKQIANRYIKITNTPIEEKLNTYLTKVKDPIEEKLNTPIEEKLKENNKYINNTTNNKYEINNIICRVIDRLNELTGSNFKPTTENTIKLIKGRLNEGYTEEDLITVVEKMCFLWGRKPKKGEKDMRPYLRPSTLFRPSNFENYLNREIESNNLTTNDLELDLSIMQN